eukprot:c14282_g2_i1 orf=209-376(+)
MIRSQLLCHAPVPTSCVMHARVLFRTRKAPSAGNAKFLKRKGKPIYVVFLCVCVC